MKLFLKIIVYFLLFSFFLSCTSFRNSNQGKTKIIDMYFTDEYNNKTQEYAPLDLRQKYIYLVVLTKNAIGKKVTLEIFDEPPGTGFIYKRKYINEKITFKIRTNKQKIKLYIYDDTNRRHRSLRKKTMKNKTTNNTVYKQHLQLTPMGKLQLCLTAKQSTAFTHDKLCVSLKKS